MSVSAGSDDEDASRECDDPSRASRSHCKESSSHRDRRGCGSAIDSATVCSWRRKKDSTASEAVGKCHSLAASQ